MDDPLSTKKAERPLQNSKDQDEDESQLRILSTAMRFMGVIEGDNPNLAENASSEVKARIKRRHSR
ncbi:MAG TPA: hypothetical protein VKK31_05410 [Thermoanaerobaculia bacterium]|nr:hypothetical protein [Thermoanaerobaculia bacterium]